MRFHEIEFFDDSRHLVDAKGNVIARAYDASKLYNVKPASINVNFTSSNSDNVTWDAQSTNKVMFTHTLNCYPIVQVYDSHNEQVYPTIKILSGTSFELDFESEHPIGENETWLCTITYGAEYGNSGNINTDVASILQSMQELHDSVVEMLMYQVGHATAYAVLQNDTQLSFTWTDPTDFITDGGVTAAHWGKTRLIMKTGGFPENESDGTVLVDNTIRDQYRENAFVWDAGVTSNYYFALFTCTTDGVWNTSPSAPRFTTDLLAWQTIGMLIRANSLLTYPNLEVGSIIDLPVSSAFPKFRYRLGDYNYTAHQPTCQDWHYDHNKRYNAILIPSYLPCLGDSNNALMLNFDAPESQYAITWDNAFVTGKAYYKYDGSAYVALVEGDDYNASDNIEQFTSTTGFDVYTKNHDQRKSYGHNNWMQSNLRQWLNTSGSKGEWFEKQNEYDVNGINVAGWMNGIDPAFLALVQPVYNKTARNTISTVLGGGGGGFDITLDKFWIPSIKEVFNTNVNGIAEGSQFKYFSSVATTNDERIQKDEGLTARNVWLRSPNASNCSNTSIIYASGASSYSLAHYAYALFACACLA